MEQIEILSYGMICISVIMFGGCFALNDVYRKLRGASSLKISLQFSLVSAAAGLVIMFLINGFKLEFSWFTLLMASLSAINGFAFSFCAFRALGSINLSLYSLFSMLGGMVLPFLQGILFYGEAVTVAKVVCLVVICAALALTVEKGNGEEKKKGGAIYYIGIFVLNGMSGVISKLFTSAPEEWGKTSAESFSILSAISAIVIAGIALIFMRKVEAPKESWAARGVSALGGITNRIANYVLLIALAHVPASVQYPMVTGGVMIVSTIICFFGKNKPKPKELVSVALAFIGILALVLIPI